MYLLNNSILGHTVIGSGAITLNVKLIYNWWLVVNVVINIAFGITSSLKGNEALEIFFFYLLQGKKIWRGNQNLKKIFKFLLFPASQTNDFLEVQKESSMVENGVFRDVINAVNN